MPILAQLIFHELVLHQAVDWLPSELRGCAERVEIVHRKRREVVAGDLSPGDSGRCVQVLFTIILVLECQEREVGTVRVDSTRV